MSKSLEDRQQTAMADLTSLSRVSHRLAMVDSSEKLQQVLKMLLPRLLKRIGDNHQAQLLLDNETATASSISSSVADALKESLSKIHAKLVEMLSHAMKRVREAQDVQIPCLAVLDLLLVQQENKEEISAAIENDPPISATIQAKPTVDPFTFNLTLAFLTLGLSRSTTQELGALLPGLLILHGYHASDIDVLRYPSRKSQWHQIAHLLLRAIEHIVSAEESMLKTSTSTITVPSNNNKRLKSSSSTASTTSGDSTMGATNNNSTAAAAAAAANDPMELARKVLHQNEEAAQAFYTLVLDVLLYQTVAGNVPPPGLSQAGNDRLKSGNSRTARDWAAEMAPRSSLVQAKLRLLDIVSPSRRWALFMYNAAEQEESDTKNKSSLGMARTVALLVASSGDAAPEVSQRATSYLKQHLDTFRNEQDGSKALGEPIAVICELLAVCVGANNAELALSKLPQTAFSIPTLGLVVSSSSPQQDQQLVLSLKRRMVSEHAFGALATFCSKSLDESPQLLKTSSVVGMIGTLAVLASSKALSELRTSSGLSVLRGKRFIAAAQLLNALAVRLSTMQQEEDEEGAFELESSSSPLVLSLMAKSLATACAVLSTVSTPRQATSVATNASSTASEGNIAVRDALYGVICALSRSKLALEGSLLFALGETQEPTIGRTLAVSMDTASLLFGCAANEEEMLRPRAVAALDALLAAYCRMYTRNKKEVPEKPIGAPEVAKNPWSQATATTPLSSEPRSEVVHQQLSAALLPLIWSASHPSQAKQSRVAAARWSSDLLKQLDLSNACHLLCFLAGDADVTAASIAKEGLGIKSDKKAGDDQDGSSILLDFGELTMLLFSKTHDPKYWRPRFWDFSHQGKAAAVKFSLNCLMSDLYGGEDDAVEIYVAALAKTVSEVANLGRECIELLDESATCLSICFSTSAHARSLVANGKTSLGLQDMEELALTANSSITRRVLAESCGSLYEDRSLWQTSQWIEAIQRPLKVCAEEIVSSHRSAGGQIHGAAFLGSRCVRAFRLHPENASPEGATGWLMACKVLGALGQGTMHTDEIISNAFADGLAIALSYSEDDAPILDQKLYDGTAAALTQLTTALKKYGNGDHADAPRASKLAHAAGICLAASTSGAGSVSSTDSINLGPARLECVAALFALLGSSAFRKDEEVALITGEALATYADAYSPKDVVWSSESADWPATLDEEFANELPPHQQVLFTLLRRIDITSNPHKRTACGPALLAVVARAASKVSPITINPLRVQTRLLTESFFVPMQCRSIVTRATRNVVL
jgi:proteasome component ECM29